MSEEDDEIKKQTVDIIIATAENIKDRNQFDDDITGQVIPVRIGGTKHTGIPTRIIRRKNIAEIFTGAGY